ncbi:unnamed protein product [Bursaphelenchus xylophilus]|uniref:(pine wood nematode) hypothetical protein n=1 Tax=Bursaphelenchus xylophilus TaxID=6326 RepID=A0A1I7S8F6_BURXY|nr:unnamed protein product [Bursaphelenchus xylophilus]CAG9121041.1 unnamed protein product [Bursaphelenchus xylophilus]
MFTRLTFLLAVYLSVVAVVALKCHTGVDSVAAGSVDCAERQCMNSTSTKNSVFGCDFSQVCDLFQLFDGCVSDGDKVVCCCASADNCNVNQGSLRNVMGDLMSV